MRKALSLLVLGLLASGCLIARERQLQSEEIDKRLFFRYGGFRGTAAGIDPRWEKDKTSLRNAVNKYIKNNPGVDSRVKRHLQSLEIAVGMTMDQVKLLWGQPHHSVVSENKNLGQGRTEQWFYDQDLMMVFSGQTWFYELHFEEGYLTKIIFWDHGQPL